ncbi:MAG: CheY-P-specific phosphatase CheC [Chloroflexota bacterium]
MIGARVDITFDEAARLQAVAEGAVTQAGRAMSEMTGTTIEITAPRVLWVPLAEVPGLLGGPEALVAGVYLSVLGDLAGHMLFAMPLAAALALVDELLEQPQGTAQSFDEMAESALAEVGNLTGSFFLGVLGDRTGLRPHPSPPAVAVDMVGAILDEVLAEQGWYGEDALMIQTTFRQCDRETGGFFLVFPDRVSLRAILQGLG